MRAARRTGSAGLALKETSQERSLMKEDQHQTRRDLRRAIIFGIVAATLELGALLYFFR